MNSNRPMEHGEKHASVVHAMMEAVRGSGGDMIAAMAKVSERCPDLSHDEFDRAMDDAVEAFETLGAQHMAESEQLERLAPLFDGMPEGMPLGECARIKAEQGDPLALSYLEWEKRIYA